MRKNVSIFKSVFKGKVFLLFIMVTIIMSQSLSLVQALEPAYGQKPMNIMEIQPNIKQGQGLLKINFKLPQGSVIMDKDEIFTVICDSVNSKGESKKQYKSLYMLRGAGSYTAYIQIDTEGGSASCKLYYKVYGINGYLNGYLAEEETKVLYGEMPLETDIQKEIEVKEGDVVEIDLNAIKGIVFSTKILWKDIDVLASSPDQISSNPNQITSKPNKIGIEFIEKSTYGKEESDSEHESNEEQNEQYNNEEHNNTGDNNTERSSAEENSVTVYYSFEENENEKAVTYTLAQDKEYSLAFYIKETNTYYNYGDISINDEARKTGYLQYQPIAINDLPANNISIDNLPFNDININDAPQNWKQLLQEKIRDVINRIIKPEMSDIDKVYAIFRYVQDNTVYGFSNNCGNAYGMLMENVSVCEGYAEATKKLLDAAGIENKMAYGVKGNGVDEGPHAWNIVKIGNEYFHLDTLQNRFNMNDSDAKDEYYIWEEGSIPECDSSFSMAQGLSFFVHDGYVYYTSGDNQSFYFDINRCKADGSENTKLLTTKNGGTYIYYNDGWIYYSRYEGAEIFRVRPDGSEESLVYSFDNNTRFHDSGMSGNAIYFLAQTGENGVYQKSIKKFDLESFEATTIATFGENMGYWNVGDHFYYYKAEDAYLNYYRMPLDGSDETLIYYRERY